MKFRCNGCGQKYRLDDEQLKSLNTPTLPCPKCSHAIPIAPGTDKSLPADPERYGPEYKNVILNEVKSLPPMPQVLMRAQAIVNDPMKSTADLAVILESDQAMTARVLKVANSAFYGLRTPATSVQNASVVLGEATLMTLITLVSTSRLMGSHLAGYGIDSDAVFHHSLLVAFASKDLATVCLADFSNDAFVAGLLHDIGKLILDPRVAEATNQFAKALTLSDGNCATAEQQLFGFDHADIGADYCVNNNIPRVQADAVRYHHHPEAADNKIAAHILHAADTLAHAAPETEEEVLETLGQSVLDSLAMTPAQVKAIWEAAAESTAQVVDSLD